MIPELYEHQKKIIKENKLKCGLFLGTGASKTRTALHLAEGKVLVICPKQQFLDGLWEKEDKKWDTQKLICTVSKEWLRAHWNELGAFDTVIIDECHNNLGVTPETRQRNRIQIPKTSQIFEATLNYLKKFPPKRLYLLSATPVSNPMNLWAIATLFGKNWDFFRFREKYYFNVLLGGQRRIWLPRKDQETKDRLVELVKGFGYTGGLNEFFDVPEQIHKEVYIDLTQSQKQAIKELHQIEADPLVRRSKQRTIENGVLYGQEIQQITNREERMVKKTTIYPSKKIDYILERAIEFPKLLIFVNYTAQINEIARVLKEEGYNVVTLTGATKDRANLINDAEKSDASIVIAQAMISEGYELPSFPCVIYASKNYRCWHYIQSLGRVLRSNNLKKNLYIHLIVKGVDEECHKTIMSGNDFQEKVDLSTSIIDTDT